mgnify:CR=1 FL=1
MVIRNSVRYLMNRLMFGSECIYHEENCIIDHVTKRATDVNRIEKKSVLKLILSSIEFMVTQCQVVIIYSILLWKNINRGKRLIMKENLIDVVVYSGKLMCLIRFDIEIRIGDSRRMKINKIEVVKIFIKHLLCTRHSRAVVVSKTESLPTKEFTFSTVFSGTVEYQCA